MLRTVPLALAAALSFVPPAGALASGEIEVGADLSACASLSFDRPTTGVGYFGAGGAMVGPGTIVGATRGAHPIVLVNALYWSGCAVGSHTGGTAGAAVFVLEFHSAGEDVLVVVRCDTLGGAVTCR